MEAPIIDDELCKLIEPLLPVVKPRAKSDRGRARVPDRVALNGILFVLKTGTGGTTCRPGWASARARHAGVDWTTGRRLACGTGCTNCCSTSCGRPTSSTSHMQRSTHRRYALLGRAQNLPESQGSSASGYQASHPRRRKRHSRRRHPHWREHQRRCATAAARRGDCADSRRAWPSA